VGNRDNAAHAQIVKKREHAGVEQPNLPLKLVVRRHRAQG
jgi:hypothetical protein